MNLQYLFFSLQNDDQYEGDASHHLNDVSLIQSKLIMTITTLDFEPAVIVHFINNIFKIENETFITNECVKKLNYN